METKLNATAIARLPIPAKGKAKLHYFAGAVIRHDTAPKGFAVKATANGTKTFVLRYTLGRVDKLYTIGDCRHWTPLNAIKEAHKLRQAIDKGEDPLQARARQQARASGADSVKAVCEAWFDREGHKLRTGEDRMRELRRLVFPEIGARSIYEVKRAELVALLDDIEDDSGPRMAGVTLAYLRKCFNWHEGRVDEWRSPITRAMARGGPGERDRA